SNSMRDVVPEVDEWARDELLVSEKELLGFYVSGHPLDPYKELMEQYCVHNSETVKELENRKVTRLGGLISTVQRGVSRRSNKPYAIATIEDFSGSFQVLCMNENYDKYQGLLEPYKTVLVIGEANNSEDTPKIFPQEVIPLDDAPAKYTKQVHFRLNSATLDPVRVGNILELASNHPGRCPLYLCFKQEDGRLVFVESGEQHFVKPSMQLQDEINELLGGMGSYYAKVDKTLPEPAKRRWRKKEGDGD
ncbi:MAG: OB-fold nucleic acid binding domain-containing protein, partial [Verrucomicrobiota bacterium]|nr:OB-fold nucleic acid binding domain-containing protein [Verrucomicrobiota bacterium]